MRVFKTLDLVEVYTSKLVKVISDCMVGSSKMLHTHCCKPLVIHEDPTKLSYFMEKDGPKDIEISKK